jgi:anti-sigma factor RsiW
LTDQDEMALPADNPQLHRRELAELSALADGTLDSSRRSEVEARIAASPELAALYERERHVVSALHDARQTERAPATLRASVEAQRPRARSRARRRVSYAGGLAGALAAVLLALVLILPSGTPGAPSLGQAAALAGLGAAAPAPQADSGAPSVKLEQQVGDVYFPNWATRFGWTAVGQRVDRLHGRLAVTVYYKRNQAVIAYTIVAAPALQQPGARVTRVHGTDLRTFRVGGRLVVTWRRAGQTCVLSGVSVPASALQHLAAWKVAGLVSPS